MKSKFIQKRGIGYRKFFLYEDKIVIESRDLRKINRYEIPIEQLGFDLQYQADNVIASKIVLAILILISVASFVSYFFIDAPKDKNISILNSVLFFLISLFAYLKPHSDDVYLVGGQKSLMFYRNRPNEESVLEFINKIIDTGKSHIRANYLKFDEYTERDEYFARVEWYKRKKVISEDEMNEFKHEFSMKKLF